MLGAATAQLLGIDRIRPGMRIWINGQVGGQWFYVTGILNPATYAPEIDSAVLVGFPAAEKYLDFDGHPSDIYVRTTPNDQAATTAVDNLLGAQANPENPSQVNVSQPSDALTAQADAKGALDALFLGLGAVALLVGAIGVANIMVISVLERRSEIGLRRGAGRHPRPDPRPVPGRGHPAVPGRRRRRRRHRRRRHRRLRPRPRRGRRHPAPGLGRRPGRGRHSSAPWPGCCPPSAPPACHRPRHSGASDMTGNRQDRQCVPSGRRPVEPIVRVSADGAWERLDASR